MEKFRQRTGIGIVPAVLVFSIFLSGCASQKTVLSPYQTRLRQKPQTFTAPQMMGYSIQAGAFSQVDNAVRLTKKLEKQGLDAFYFTHSSGLYKVRFGNYTSQNKALTEARRLQQQGIIDAFYVVKPGEYAIARGKSSVGVSIRDDIVDTAHSFIGLPYQWGTCSLSAPLDCSGLVMAVYQLNGMNVPRTSEEQYKSGTPVPKEQLEKGDLVFFSTTSTGRVSHVGIYIGDDMFIHAPGTGKTICADSLSSTYYQDRFYGACTYIR
ncbi:MAG TPA: NlpC/P60 family protein [Desulfomonilia bacterium]|nr:NlpC/P60 family protein [Desulfomonilia bacterium]